MDRLMVAVDTSVGVTPKEFALAWDADAEASAWGAAVVRDAGGEAFLPGLLELVVLPVAVNLASAALYDLVRRLVGRARQAPVGVDELEVVQATTGRGDRVVVVRLRRVRS